MGASACADSPEFDWIRRDRRQSSTLTAPGPRLFRFKTSVPRGFTLESGDLTNAGAGTSIAKRGHRAMRVTHLLVFALLVLGYTTSAAAADTVLTLQVGASVDDVNEVNNALDTTSTTQWIGNGGATTGSYAGMRFTSVLIPRGSLITSAYLQVYSTQNQWISCAFSIAADAVGNSSPFTSSTRPSQRTPTANAVTHSDNVSWAADTWYALDDMRAVVQEIVGRPDWQAGNSLSIILRGTGSGAFSRKFVRSFDSGAANAPRLVVTYTSSGTPLPSATLTAAPTTITAGQAAMLTWTSSNAFTVSIDQGIGAVPMSGSVAVSPTTTTAYTATAANSAGSIQATASITVNPLPAPPTVTFTASPNTLVAGSASTLSWNATSATTVTIDHGIGLVPPSGSQSVNPTTTTIYTLTAANSSGSTVNSATVTVVPSPPGGTITSQIVAAADDVNEVNGTLTTDSWLGNGGSTTTSYAGLRFVNLPVPPGSTITSAHLQVYSLQSQWIGYSFTIAAEATGNSATFSASSPPSQRAQTVAQISHNDNVKWAADTWYSLDEMKAVIQEVIDRADWQAGNSLSIVIKGTGNGTFARKFVANFNDGSANAPTLIVSYTTTSLPPPPTTTTNVPPTGSGSGGTVGPPSATATYFALGPGFSDVVPHQIIRTATDRLYVFAAQPSGTALTAQWTPKAGLPNSGSDFGGSAQTTLAAIPISVSPAYDGAATVHVFANLENGALVDVPFDLVTNAFRPARTIANGLGTVAGDYLGSSGVAAMVDNTGYLHVAYWTSANQIVHVSYSYNSSSDTLSQESAPIGIDITGNARHPSLAVSPLDNSVTVAWVSLATTPKQIVARVRDTSGAWTALQNVSNPSVDVWTSTSAGIDIDQGPSLIITNDGVKHVAYIENYDSSGDYGAVHYASNNGGGWTDQKVAATYSHDPALAVTAAGQLYLIGHGHQNDAAPQCRSEDDICVSQRNTDGTWTAPNLFARHAAGGSFDSSPSVKWSVVGWNRPEAIEFLFFQTPYTAPTLFYGANPVT